MCEDCGCEEAGRRALAGHPSHAHGHSHAHAAVHPHTHGDVEPHTHGHAHGHTHSHGHPTATAAPPSARQREISLETRVLARNDAFAADNRAWLDERGIVAVNLVSSPGSGKTTLLEKTLSALEGKVSCAVITGDVRTDHDAQRLLGKGAPVVNIETQGSCHLDAERVGTEMRGLVQDDTQLLIIENVGNLVCPAAFDLGEHFKIGLVSVTEGEDKPTKYPVLFLGAPVTLITKTDLVPHLDWDMALCRKNIRRLRPDAQIFELSARNGEGMDAWLRYLADLAR